MLRTEQMGERTSRRRFLKSAGLAAGAMGLRAASGAEPSVAEGEKKRAGTVSSEESVLTRAGVEAELRRRAERFLAQTRLVVDYYRIRRRLAYALPLKSLAMPKAPVPSLPDYPWATWLTWELEERVNSLGWAAEWFGDEAARDAAARDLAALAEWPEYRQYRGPDLCSAHTGRILWMAYTKWRWPDAGLRDAIKAACLRHVEDVLKQSDEVHGAFKTKDDLLALAKPHEKLHNIPIIGTLGAALTAYVAQHPRASDLNQRLGALLGAVLDLRLQGTTEGVAYDGYVLDFVADWLHVAPADPRRAILDHPALAGYLQESYMLGAPGAAANVAPLSDVEPREMPFHLSAQAKLFDFQPQPVRAWHLSRCPVAWLRTDALAALREAADGCRAQAPDAGALNAQYAAVLRSGWGNEDVAVAVSCTNSPMSHVQCDNGSLVLGTQGEWLITDPGYQQYMEGDERAFTVGPAAHNAPVVNGLAQTRKAGRPLACAQEAESLWRATVELTACYPAEAKLVSSTRTIWLATASSESVRAVVAVADEVKADAGAIQRLTYHWHGHPDAAWWAQDGWALVHGDKASLWFTSPQAAISDANIQRLPGSRGQLTLVADAEVAAPVVWWVFALSETPPPIHLTSDGRQMQVLGWSFKTSG